MNFSIVTPCLNDLASLPRAVGSVRGQEGVEVEHVIQDGGSEDGTPAWLASREDLGWASEPDSGMYQAINRGWTRTTGEILAWLNADEQYLPGTLRRVAETFSNHPGLDVIWGNAIVVQPDGVPIAARREIPLRAFYLRNVTCYAYTCTMFFRRRLLEEGVLWLDESFRVSGDKDLMLRLLEKGRRFAHLPLYLSLFGVSGSNLSTTMKEQVKLESLRIGERHHTRRSGWERSLVRGVRYLEKGFKGCFFTDRVSYSFAIDEAPTYREIPPTRVGFSFRI